jgi:short-subunit dehydrogenase
MVIGLGIVTGASGGIGRALAREHAARGGDLIVTARTEGALRDLADELQAEFGTAVDVVPADMADPAGWRAVIDAAAGRDVEVLIANAGFGGRGAFLERDLDDDFAMIDVNVRAVLALIHAIAPGMVARGRGRVLIVGSTAGMLPGPLQATYFASKAFVNSFGPALDQELRAQGVTVTVLAPGYVETGFAARAGLEGTGLAKQSGRSAEQTAAVGYAAMEAGRLLAVNEPGLAFATRWLLPFAPRRMLLKTVHRMQAKG